MSTDPIIRVPRYWLGRQALARMPAFWRLPAHISPFRADAMFVCCCRDTVRGCPSAMLFRPVVSSHLLSGSPCAAGVAGSAARMRICSVRLTP